MTPFIFQIVGYQNRGKTTFITKLIRELKENNLSTAVLKHHGHGGKPDTGHKKDSTKHFEAGAAASLVEGDGAIELLGNLGSGVNLPNLLRILEMFHPDIILVEGYKQENYQKLILIKEEKDLDLLQQLTNIQAVVAWPSCLEQVKKVAEVPVFPLDSNDFSEWFIQQYTKRGQ